MSANAVDDQGAFPEFESHPNEDFATGDHVWKVDDRGLSAEASGAVPPCIMLRNPLPSARSLKALDLL